MKISIVIPSFNRAHLIGETLDSILAQTYSNWECLIVNDGSTDNSEEVYQYYKQKDNRFLFLNRPKEKPKGANACRNIGLKKATGDYIVFFDSDDLMTKNHLEVKVKGILENNCDYVITRTEFFNSDDNYLDSYYTFDAYDITPYNYISQKLNWLTYDICLKREIAQSIEFNELLQSGQEYNYFSKLTYQSTRGIFLNVVVTKRRKHEQSIRAKLKSKKEVFTSSFTAKWFTYLDIEKKADKPTIQYLLKNCINIIYNNPEVNIEKHIVFILTLIKKLGVRGFLYLPMLWTKKLFNKGHFFRKELLKGFKE